MKLKQLTASILTLAMVTGLSGCGGSTTTPTASTGAASAAGSAAATSSKAAEKEVIPAGATVINFWHSMTSGTNLAAIKKLTKEFNETNGKNIYVKETAQGAYNDCSTKIQQSIAAGTNPEVVMLDRALAPKYTKLNALEDLTPYATKDNVDVADFVEGLMSFSKDGDKLISLPFNRSTPVLYYNKDIFKEVGLDPEKAPTTYDELYDYATKLTVKKDGKTTRYGFEMVNDPGWFLMGMIQQQGGKMLSDDGTKVLSTSDGTSLKALTFWDKMIKEGICAKPAVKDAGTDMMQKFYQGQIAMMYQSTGNMSAIIKNTVDAKKFDVGVANLCQFTTPSCPTGGANISILAKVSQEKKDAAWEFVKFATSAEKAAQFSVDTGYVPTRKAAVETDAIKALWAKHPQFKVAYDQLQYASDTCVSENFWEYNSMMSQVTSSLITDGKISPEEANKRLEDEAAKLFPGNKK